MKPDDMSDMKMKPDDIKERLSTSLGELSPSYLDVVDESHLHRGHREAKNGAHYRVTIASPRFAGVSPLHRHRMVFAAVGDLAAAGVHALSVKTLAPGELSTVEKP